MSCFDICVGTVLEFDPVTGAGLIEADDGRILLLRANDVIPADADLVPGRCVHFVEEDSVAGPRAIVLTVLRTPLADLLDLREGGGRLH
jgi:cold shock CspA family protein